MNRVAESAPQEPFEGEVISESQTFERGSSVAITLGRALLCFVILIAAIPFGAVHERPFELLRVGVAFVATILLLSPEAKGTLSQRPALSFLRIAGLYFLALFLCYFFWRQTTPEHPLLGPDFVLTSFEEHFDYLVSVLWFTLTVLATYLAFGINRKTLVTGTRWIAGAGVLVSLIALLHWLNDNGKLFWIFEPEYVTFPERARWPFVNPNHLGHFLVAPLAFSTFHLAEQLRRSREEFAKIARTKRGSFSYALSTKSMQSELLTLILWFSGAVLIFLALTLSLSRSSWIATAFLGTSTAILAVRSRRRRRKQQTPTTPEVPRPSLVDLFELKNARMSKRAARRHYIRTTLYPYLNQRLLRPIRENLLSLLLLLASATLLTIFLSSGSFERVDARLEYTYGKIGKDDTRLMMYRDSLPMITERPLFGHGTDGWSQAYSRFKSPELSDARPRYLHSDPMQHVVEFGIVGTFPLLLLLAWLIRTTFFIAPQNRSVHPEEIISRLSGLSLLALFIASFFDFPFHIPAIPFLYGAVLGLHFAALRLFGSPSQKIKFP